MRKFKKPHRIYELYSDYQEKIISINQEWVSEHIPDAPDTEHFLLNDDLIKILIELDSADATSFRFRYPSLGTDGVDYLQEKGWKHNPEYLYPETGLPKESGYFFNHLQVVNSMHKLVKNLQKIRRGFDSYNGFQEIMNDYLEELEQEFHGSYW